MKIGLFVASILLTVANVQGQQVQGDTIANVQRQQGQGDTIMSDFDADTTALITVQENVVGKDGVGKDGVGKDSLKLEKPVFGTHSPKKAAWMAAILPTSGQFYNGQWWKTPFIYAGIGATIYGLVWNGSYYNKYRTAFIDYSLYLEAKTADPENAVYPENASWDKLYLRGGVDEFTDSQANRFKQTLENKKTRYGRDRDLLIIVMVGIYAIQILDASVYAYFYDFEIDEDLTMNIQPTFSPMGGGMLGVSLTFNF
ncbi:hypothetical protein FACS1894199_14130 [Bacteroidia bacterium]|nr:hypothetical protein FACS1894199_14130 [Bacteroidia bacterium]